MLQRLSIRGKLFAVVAVPTVVLLLAALFVLWTSAAAFFESRNNAQMVSTVQAADPLLSTISEEYTLSATYLRAISDGNAKRTQAQSDIDDALDALYVAAIGNATNQSIASQMRLAVDEPTGLPAARAVALVDTVDGDFPDWPSAEEVDAASGLFNGVIAQISTLAFNAGAGSFGDQARDIVTVIAAERDAQQIMLDDARTYAERLPEAFRLTDNAAAGYQTAAAEQGSAGSLALQRSIAEVNAGLASLPALRDSVRTGSVQPGTAESAYEATMSDLVDLSSGAADAINDRELSASLGAYSTLAGLYTSMYLEQQWVGNELRKGQWVLGDSAAFQQRYFGTDAALEAAQGSMTALQDPPEIPNFGVSYNDTDRTGFEVIRNRLLTDPTDEALVGQRTSNWESQVAEEMEAYDPARAALLDRIDSRTAALSRTSLIQLAITAALVILAVVASQLIAQSIARRIENPLRRLTTTATAVRQELPRLVERVAMPGQSVDVTEVQIPVESSDEVGRLAEAFNSVNAATLAIAAEQAALRGSISEMFVNVARRDQVLLNRQLASIDEMERTQDDPDTLTKLFALDHLATRMRRNSESLLVLAGIDTGRRLRRPMPLSDVIRTASSEIELYERVQLELDADPAMLGHSALTAAHLFAELLENATVFSDPGTPVVVHTMARDGAVVVTITDSGIGMTPEELSEANSRVASTAASEILGAQRLGLFVVGRIARRVGARVHLESEESKGTVATVVMPPSLFDSSVEPIPMGAPDELTEEEFSSPTSLVMHDEPRVVQAPPSSPLPAYAPTIIEGAPLLGREAPSGVDAERQPSDTLPTRLVADEPTAMSSEVEQIMAADAAEAPEGIAVDLDSLTEGQTPQGLPTRRRRGATAAEAPKDTSSILALPQRASDEQLTALASAATTGFTPILAADEVSPESAEQRARVFRGFRSMREGDQAGAEVAPDAESLGQAMRRGAAAETDTQPFGTPAAEQAAPTLGEAAERLRAEVPTDAAPAAQEAPRSEPVPLVQPEPEPAPVQVQAPAEPAPTPMQITPMFDEAPFAPAVQDAPAAQQPAPEAPPITRQSPLIQTGFGPGDGAAFGAAPSPAEMAVPLLEEDEGPAYDARPWESRAREQAGVEAVSFEEDEGAPASQAFRSPLYPSAGRPVTGAIQRPARQPWAEDRGANVFRQQVDPQRMVDENSTAVPSYAVQQHPAAPAPAPAPVQQAPVQPEPMPQADAPAAHAQSPYALPAQPMPGPDVAQQQVPPQPVTAFDHGPVTSTPSLDDLIMDGNSGAHDRSGFFGRIFGGKSSRKDEAPLEAPRATPFAPVTGSVPQVSAPAPMPPATFDAPPAPLGGAAPWAAAAQQPAAAPQAPFQPAPAPAPQASAAPTFQPEVQAPATPQAPLAPVGEFAPQQFSPEAVGRHDAMNELTNQAAWPFGRGGEPVPSQQPLQPAPSTAAAWGVQPQDQWGPAEEYRSYDHAAYSPDQLAKPLGWEEAGATALEASAPESASEYRPVVQIAPEPTQGGYDAADVFSELSSLATKRPKVEKTKAGLVKRTPVERAAPLDDAPAAQASENSVPRDAEAVRSRFAAFYSGTQRARSATEGFDGAATQPLTES